MIYTITLNTYQVITKDEILPSLLASDSHRGGGVAVVTYQAITGTIAAGAHPGSYNGQDAYNDMLITEDNMSNTIVRRLTPMECERLQGYPDGWTLIGEPEEVEVKDYEYTYDEDGNETSKTLVGTHTEIEYFYTDINGKRKKCADSARYKALGNSIAVGYANNQSGFWMWLMKRISAQYTRRATLGSLFDGIGGFPLAWETYNGKGSAVWASEIEPFCIEVTRRRFPEVEE